MSEQPQHKSRKDLTPSVILVIGTDASGKDHVANLLVKMIEEKGLEVEKRKRFLSGKVTRAATSEGKNRVETLMEKSFLTLYPWLGPLLPLSLDLVNKLDLFFFKKPEKTLVIVGHNGLRGLAFYLSKQAGNSGKVKVPGYIGRTLKKFVTKHRVHTIILDVEDSTRKRRIRERVRRGTNDQFDNYMLQDGQRSEIIESCLVEIVTHYLDGTLIKNDDLPEQELRKQILTSFANSKHYSRQ